MVNDMVDAFEKETGRALSEGQRAALADEFAWFEAKGAWRCTSLMSNGMSDIRCERAEDHPGPHRGRFLNGSARVWGRSSPNSERSTN